MLYRELQSSIERQVITSIKFVKALPIEFESTVFFHSKTKISGKPSEFGFFYPNVLDI